MGACVLRAISDASSFPSCCTILPFACKYSWFKGRVGSSTCDNFVSLLLLRLFGNNRIVVIVHIHETQKRRHTISCDIKRRSFRFPYLSSLRTLNNNQKNCSAQRSPWSLAPKVIISLFFFSSFSSSPSLPLSFPLGPAAWLDRGHGEKASQ